MTEYEIRLDQTKKVFEAIAEMIKYKESCSYRYLIYDILGFKQDAYIDLIAGMIITNLLVDLESKGE